MFCSTTQITIITQMHVAKNVSLYSGSDSWSEKTDFENCYIFNQAKKKCFSLVVLSVGS